MEAYQLHNNNENIAIKNTDAYAIIHKKNGQAYKQEFYFGSNYLSQSSRVLSIGKVVTSVTIYDTKGNKREQIIKQ